MRYLVLGSSGVIGTPLWQHLARLDNQVTLFDIEEGPEQDIRTFNNELLERSIMECDFVFHLAWDVGGSLYLQKYQDTFDFAQNNLKIMVNSFDMIKKYNKPFIFASSQMSNMSFSSYGLTKAIGEKLTASLGGLVVKFWNVYGPEHNLEKSHVITDFILKAKEKGVIDMRTDGTELRQMLYATDCSLCLHLLSQRYADLPRDNEYHITSFEWVSVLEIANIIAKRFPGTVIIPAEATDTGQYDMRNEPNPHILNYWKPSVSLENGIDEIIKAME